MSKAKRIIHQLAGTVDQVRVRSFITKIKKEALSRMKAANVISEGVADDGCLSGIVIDDKGRWWQRIKADGMMMEFQIVPHTRLDEDQASTIFYEAELRDPMQLGIFKAQGNDLLPDEEAFSMYLHIMEDFLGAAKLNGYCLDFFNKTALELHKAYS